MTPELEQKIIKKFPKIFQMVESTPKGTCKQQGLFIGDGWYWIVDKLCKSLQYDTDKNGYNQVVAAQVKEKFGGLRFYVDGASEGQYEVIHFVESLTYDICETCGSTKDVGQTGGWIKTMCKKCANDNNKELKDNRVKTDLISNEDGTKTRYVEFPTTEEQKNEEVNTDTNPATQFQCSI